MRGREADKVHLASRGAFMPFIHPTHSRATQSYHDILPISIRLKMAGGLGESGWAGRRKAHPGPKCGVKDRDGSLEQAMSTNEGYDVARCG